MSLILAIFLFIAAGFASIVEHGQAAGPAMEEAERRRIRSEIVDPHKIDAMPEGDKRREVYKNLIDAYLVLFVETPALSSLWATAKKKRTPARLRFWSGFTDEFGAGDTANFHRLSEIRHQSVQIVTDILGYDISNVPESQFWKVASDFEERFGFWSELHVKANHPSVIDCELKSTSKLDQKIKLEAYKLPTENIINALREKDRLSLWSWARISPFFNDQRETEIAKAFIENNIEKKRLLSDEIGFDVQEAGRWKTILAFADKEKWYAHIYINPALAYPEYGLMLFGRHLRNYNAWRELFGVTPIGEEKLVEARSKIQALLDRYAIYESKQNLIKEKQSSIDKTPFYPYNGFPE